MKALALDFDGVICNSSRELFLVAAWTLADVLPHGVQLASIPAPDRAAPADLERPFQTPLYRRFMRMMPLGNRAEDFGVALVALLEARQIADQVSYDAFFATQDPAFLTEFHRRFYEVRHLFAATHPELWLSLQPAYQRMLAFLRRHSDAVPMAIVTAKDRLSVRALLVAYGISGLFPEKYLLDKETGVSKVAHLECLRALLGIEFPELCFVDDKLNHLERVAGLGVRCALAAWGYNGPREREEARKRGYLVCGLANLEALLSPTG